METRSAKKKQQYAHNGEFNLAANDIQSIAASKNGKEVPGAVEAPQVKQDAIMHAVQSTCALVLYLLSSSLIIILNKRLMVDDGFKFPLALTGLSQVAGALAGKSSAVHCQQGDAFALVNTSHNSQSHDFPCCPLQNMSSAHKNNAHL